MTTDDFKLEYPDVIPGIPNIDKPIGEQLNDNIDRPERHNVNPANRPPRSIDPLSPRNIEHSHIDNINPNYYTDMKIPPNVYIIENNLNWEQSNIVKYISRYKGKNGKEDLLKVIKYAEMLIEREYPLTP